MCRLMANAVLVQPPEIVGREVDADRDPLLTEGVDYLPEDIFAIGRMHDTEAGCLGVPHTETRVVLRRENDIFETGQFSEPRPFIRFEMFRIEELRKLFEESLLIFRGCANQRVRDDAAERPVYAPVNEKAKAAVAKFFHPGRLILPLLR